jgi:hypothetical protein
MSMLQSGLAWLSQQRHAHMSHAVTYARGSTSVAINATPGRTVLELVDQNGFPLRIDAKDWLIRATDLGNLLLPEDGDRVTEIGTDGRSRTYEVMRVGGEPCWRYADPNHATIRVHSKLVATE